MLNQTYLTTEQHEGLQAYKETLEADVKTLNEEIVKEAIAQRDFRSQFTRDTPMSADDREKLEKMKAAQIERGDRLTAIQKELRLYNYEVKSDAPVSREDLQRVLDTIQKSKTQKSRAGFPEDELASEQASVASANVPTIFDAQTAWLKSLNEGRGLDRFFKNDGTGVSVVSFKARWGDRAVLTHEDEKMFDVASPDNAVAVKEAIKSGFTTSPNNPNFPFGGGTGNFGAFCGWVHLPLNCMMPFPENNVADAFTRHTETDASFVTFDRQLTTANGFAPVPETIASGLTLTRAANKPFVDYGFLTVVIPLVSIAGLYTISEQALRKCASTVARIRETAETQFGEREAIQMLQGTGGTADAPQLLGLLNQAGVQQHVFRGAPYNSATDNIPDAIAEAITSLLILGCRADTVIMNPTDVLKTQLIKDTQGRPIYTNASTGELYAVPNFFSTPYMTAQTSIVTAKSNIHDVDDGEVQFAMGWINDDFRQNLRRLRWERMKAVFVCRPECLVKTTGLGTTPP